MNTNTIFTRVELSFWNILISLMSNSPLFQRCFRSAYTLTRSSRIPAWLPMLVISWASLGLLAGFVIGRMGASLW